MVENNVTPIYKRKKFTGKQILAKVFIFFILLVMYAPIILLMVYSFTESKQVGVWTGFSWKNYIMLFSPTNVKSRAIWEAVANTVIIALVSSILSTVLGTIGAIGMFYSKKKVKNTLDFITQIPVVNAEIVMALSLTILFVMSGIRFSYLTLIIGHMVLSIPFVVLSVQPKLTQMDPNLYEAGMDLGATPRQALTKIVLPEVMPGVVSGFVLAVTLSLDDYIITYFTKPKIGFNTLSTYVENVTKKAGLPSQLRALTTLIFVGILIFMIIYNITSKRKEVKRNAK